MSLTGAALSAEITPAARRGSVERFSPKSLGRNFLRKSYQELSDLAERQQVGAKDEFGLLALLAVLLANLDA